MSATTDDDGSILSIASDSDTLSSWVDVKTLQLDDRKQLCIVDTAEGSFVPFSCLLALCRITENELESIFRELGLGMSKLKAANDDVCEMLENLSHIALHSAVDGYRDPEERLLPLEGVIAYLKILGHISEASAVREYLVRELNERRSADEPLKQRVASSNELLTMRRPIQAANPKYPRSSGYV